MKALVAIQNFDSYKPGDIILKTEGDYVGYLLSNGHCSVVEFDNAIRFPKTQWVEEVAAINEYWSKTGEANQFAQPIMVDPSWTMIEVPRTLPEYWFKEGNLNSETQPMVADISWTFNEAVGEEPAFWSKDGELNVSEQPMIADESWIYHASQDVVDTVYSKEGEANQVLPPMIQDASWTYHPYVSSIPAHYEIVEDMAQLKAFQVNDAHAVMEAEVLAQMAVVFGTTNPESAAAYKQTYDLMLAKPSLFVGKLGLIDEVAVTTYATTKITAIEEYSVWRMERIAQFKTERDAILGA